MNKESNTYTILYAAIMVVIVALVLAFASQALKAPQQANEKIDKMEQILRSVNITANNKKAVAETYKSVIQKEVLISSSTGAIHEEFTGDQIAENTAFSMSVKNPLKSVRQGNDEKLPLFVANIDGKTIYIVPLFGSGLWGDIWGYLGIDESLRVVGADFGHAGETPGLGAEIVTPKFRDQFKDMFIGNVETGIIPIAVVKAGHANAKNNEVDGVTGGTLTSNGVNDMLRDCIKAYAEFFQKVLDQQSMSSTKV